MKLYAVMYVAGGVVQGPVTVRATEALAEETAEKWAEEDSMTLVDSWWQSPNGDDEIYIREVVVPDHDPLTQLVQASDEFAKAWARTTVAME